MKFFLSTLFLSFFSLCFAQTKITPPHIDQRVEMLSIAFRLAEASEYSSNRYPAYVQAINDHFSPYKDHELIQFIQQKLRKKGVSYDAVMFMAIHLSDDYPFKPRKPFSKTVPESRWGKRLATKFVALLNAFYVDAHCADFFKAQIPKYDLAVERFTRIYEELDISWYQSFYGQAPKGEFVIVNGLGNGGGNYGPHYLEESGKEIIYAIMGTWKTDSLGQPTYSSSSYFPTLVHEFNHSFVNHVVEKYHTDLSASGELIFDVLKDPMYNQSTLR